MRSKIIFKAALFFSVLTIADILLRGGVIWPVVPIPAPAQVLGLVYFGLFAFVALGVTAWFCRRDQVNLSTIGIDVGRKNRRDFTYGLAIGMVAWSLVALTNSAAAGFSWQLHAENAVFNIWFGLMFIFVADLGTELYVRGYGLTRLKSGFGPTVAILAVAILVGARSYSPELRADILLFAMLIPVLHAVLFGIVYFKTGRLGLSVGIHTGGNFATISLFDLDGDNSGQLIPPGLFQPDTAVETLSVSAIQIPFVIAALVLIAIAYFWRSNRPLKVTDIEAGQQ